MEQVYHDVVTRSDNLGNRTGSVFDEVLRVAEPYVRTMRQTRDLKQVGEVLRPRVLKHLHCERRTELRDTVCPAGRKYVLRSNSERLGGYEQVVNCTVGGGYVRDLHSGHILEVLVKRRNIVSQLVELQNRIVQRMEVEVQRPQATACASLELWNEKMMRWVNRGAKGIALLDETGTKAKIRYVFDIKDTHMVQGGRSPYLWQLQEHQRGEVLAHLSDVYNLEEKDTADLADALMSVAKEMVNDDYGR